MDSVIRHIFGNTVGLKSKLDLALCLREGFKKSKWKFKMAFAMKGGGGLEGVSSDTYLF